MKKVLVITFLLFASLINLLGQFTISISSNPAEGGLTTGAGTYDPGVSATVIATPAAGYRFVDWTEGATSVSTNASYIFTVEGNRDLVANFVQQFTISTSSSPTTGGTTGGGGLFDAGASATATATPAAGYRFVNWTEGASIVSTNASYTFIVSANRSLVANFVQQFTIATSSSPTEGGTTGGGGTFDSGASATVIATPASGFKFLNWKEGNATVSTNASYTFSVTANRTLVANFSAITYTITTSSNPVEGGTVSGGGTYNVDASATVIATPAAGYRFVNWTEGGSPVSSIASYTFIVTSNRTLIANFIQTFTIATSSSPASGGSTAGGGTYDSGASATVTATPAAGYRFLNWTEGASIVSTNASYNFTVSANRTLVANFIQTYTISTSSSPTAGGTTVGGGTYDTGSSATVTATPAAGYRFSNWTEGGSSVSTSASYTFTVLANRTLVANFVQQFTISTSSSPTAGGTTGGGGLFDNGTSATVTASPAAGYRFVNWTEGATSVSTNSSYTFSVSANRTLVANFAQQFTISTSSSPTAGGTTGGGGLYDSGASATVTASPAAGYRFVNWTEGASPVSTNPSYTFSVSASRTLVANFIQTYTISTSSSPTAGGTTIGGGTYDTGTSATVTATPAAGYRFVNWTEGASSVSTNASYTFTVSANRSLVANFVQQFTITTSSTPTAGGTTGGGGIYDSGASATVTAYPAAGYRFVNWTEGASPVSTSASFTFTVSASRTLVANFIQIFSITTSSSPATGGTTGGGGTYDSGASATVTASPAAGYRFVNWTEGASPVSTNPSYTFSVSASRTLVANFIQIYTISTSSVPTAGGTTAGAGTYDTGASATVTATPAAGYRFVNWTEGATSVSTNAIFTFSVSANRSLVANFVQQFTISTSSSPTIGGTTGGGGLFDTGASATVTATPAAGYRFVNWTEGAISVSTTSNYTFSVSANRTLVANFAQQFTISTSSSPTAGGTTTGGGTYDSGASATVTATPAAGYRFANWTEGGSPVSASASYNFTVSAGRILVANFIRIYTVTTSSSPTAGGTTAGGGIYDSGASATVTATPAAGYRFVNWTEGGLSVSANASYTFPVTAGRTLVANFIQIYNIAISSNPTAGGTTSGGGIYDVGATAILLATPGAGYRFVNWTEGGSPVSTNAGYTFTVSASRTLVANFIQIFSITTSSNPTAGGTTFGGGIYDSGASATVTATPAAGYRFANWTEGGSPVSASASYNFTVSAGRILVANFIRIYTVTTSSSPTAGGTTAGGGIYDSGASATVTATPAAGYRFVNWTEGGLSVSANASYTFSVTSGRTLVANFIQIYSIAISSNPTAGGTTAGGGIYDIGASAILLATPAAGYRFVNWTEGGSSVSVNAGYTFTVSGSRTLVANFIQIFSITTSSNPTAGGTTSGGNIYDSGASATVTAIPATGYRFVNWTEGGSPVSVNASYTFTVSTSRTLSANFIQIYNISTISSPTTGGTTTGGGIYDSGASATVTATPATGYRFVNWTEGGSPVATSASYNFTVSAVRTLTANFIQIYSIAISSNPTTGGTTAGGGIYDVGATAILLATPAAGYRFVNWTEGGTSVSAIASYTFTVSSSRSLVANFMQIYTVETSSNPAVGGTTGGGGTYDTGTSATVTATPAAGYRFVSWTEGGSAVSASANYTFTVSSTRSLVANFIQIYTLETSSNPTVGGTTGGGGTYDTGSSVTVTATPSAGFRFVNWTEGGSSVSANASYTFTVSASRTLTANFIRIFTVVTSSSPATGGTTGGGGTYDTGTPVTVTATPSAGYRFVNWTEGGSSASANASYTFTVSSNSNLVANFIRIYTVATSSNPTAGGTTAGGGTFDSGTSVTVTATAAAGYRFVSWMEGGSSVSANASYNFTISGSRSLAANFVRIYTISTTSNPLAGGTTGGGGTYDSGASVTVTATPVLGYQFDNWTENGSVVSSNVSYNFQVTSIRNLAANFSLIPVIFNISDPEGTLLQDNDTIKINTSDAGSLFIRIESNFDWTVSENSLGISAVKENNTSVKVTYLENISALNKISSIKLENQLKDEKLINIQQKARVSSIILNTFDNTLMYPNPANNFVSFKLNEGNFEKIIITFTNIQGHLLLLKEFWNIPGNEILNIEVAKLPVGQYFVRIGDGKYQKTFNMIKY